MQGPVEMEQQDSKPARMQIFPVEQETPPRSRCRPQATHLQSPTSPSAFARSPSQRLPPVHLSTVGRAELVVWINQELDLNLNDISQCNNGAVACQMCDRLNPDTSPINMKKVDFNANSSYYKEKNWRLLQNAFNILQMDYNIDVQKCQNGNQLPLLMLFRYFKQRFDQWTTELAAAGQQVPPYNAAARRQLSKTGNIKDSSAPIPPLQSSTTTKQISDEADRRSGSAVKDGDSAMESASIDKIEAIAANAQPYDEHISAPPYDTYASVEVKKGTVWRRLKRALSGK